MTLFLPPTSSRIIAGDAIGLLGREEANSVDGVLIDTPYNVGIDRRWDVKGSPADYQAWCGQWTAGLYRVIKPGGHLLAFGGNRTIHRLVCALEDVGFEVRDLLGWAHAQGLPKGRAQLKPSWEPIVLARKPLEGTLAQNLALWGVGDLNIEDCRTPYTDAADLAQAKAFSEFRQRGLAKGILHQGTYSKKPGAAGTVNTRGRWPANVLLTEGIDPRYDKFFLIPRARKENGWRHPTAKPLALMERLVGLISRPGQTILDCFCGGGSTLVACIRRKRRFIGMDLDASYISKAVERLLRAGASFGPTDGAPTARPQS